MGDTFLEWDSVISSSSYEFSSFSSNVSFPMSRFIVYKNDNEYIVLESPAIFKKMLKPTSQNLYHVPKQVCEFYMEAKINGKGSTAVLAADQTSYFLHYFLRANFTSCRFFSMTTRFRRRLQFSCNLSCFKWKPCVN